MIDVHHTLCSTKILPALINSKMHSGSIEFMRVQRLARQAFIQKYSTVKSLDAKLRMLIADVVIHSWPERFVSLCESVFAPSAECPPALTASGERNWHLRASPRKRAEAIPAAD